VNLPLIGSGKVQEEKKVSVVKPPTKKLHMFLTKLLKIALLS
jgi:hypothetical protein